MSPLLGQGRGWGVFLGHASWIPRLEELESLAQMPVLECDSDSPFSLHTWKALHSLEVLNMNFTLCSANIDCHKVYSRWAGEKGRNNTDRYIQISWLKLCEKSGFVTVVEQFLWKITTRTAYIQQVHLENEKIILSTDAGLCLEFPRNLLTPWVRSVAVCLLGGRVVLLCLYSEFFGNLSGRLGMLGPWLLRTLISCLTEKVGVPSCGCEGDAARLPWAADNCSCGPLDTPERQVTGIS